MAPRAVNLNELTGNRPEDLGVLAGRSVLNGTVRPEAVAAGT
ncbi:MAG: hypothetical protein WBV64_05355 [Mycobacterium sp.]